MKDARTPERALRWMARQVVRDQSSRLRVESRTRDRLTQWRYDMRRWRAGRGQRRAADHVLEDLWRRLHPRRLARGTLTRVGGDGDGGYVIAAMDGTGTLVSIGVGADNAADLQFAERGWHVVEWDPTIAGPPVAHPRITFHAIGLGPAGVDRRLTLPRIIEASEISGTAIIMIDIEGDEWLSGIEVSSVALAHFEQIVIELHDLHRIIEPAHRKRLMELMDVLLEGHQVVHVHANNCSPLYWVRGLPLPEVLEVSLVARTLMTTQLVEADLPMPLDRPNDPALRDHALPLRRIAARHGTMAP